MAKRTGMLLYLTALLGIIPDTCGLCDDCDRSLCLSDEQCYISTLDECGCCTVCVR